MTATRDMSKAVLFCGVLGICFFSSAVCRAESLLGWQTVHFTGEDVQLPAGIVFNAAGFHFYFGGDGEGHGGVDIGDAIWTKASAPTVTVVSSGSTGFVAAAAVLTDGINENIGIGYDLYASPFTTPVGTVNETGAEYSSLNAPHGFAGDTIDFFEFQLSSFSWEQTPSGQTGLNAVVTEVILGNVPEPGAQGLILASVGFILLRRRVRSC